MKTDKNDIYALKSNPVNLFVMFIPFIIPNVSDIGAGSQCYVGIHIPRVLAAWNDSSVKSDLYI